jgi:uncharacterized protein (UPF0332 family)
MISYEECVEKGMLRKIAPSSEQAKSLLGKAKIMLGEAEVSVDNRSPNSAVLAAYAAMFDAARALLFRDGYRERSHACTARYLEEKYSNEIGIGRITMLDGYRDRRHKVSYSAEYYPTLDEARKMLEFAEEFTGKIESLL